jgi:AcrR family transcriptional regulator
MALSKRAPKEVRKADILSAAEHLFARNGYNGTTTRALAERAGVNEAILFRYFGGKEELYWEMMETKARTRRGAAKVKELLAQHASDDEAFFAIGLGMLERLRNDDSLFRLFLYSALENHKLSHRFIRIVISEYLEAIAARVKERIASGEFRKTQPTLAARSFVGMFIYHHLIQELGGGERFDAEETARNFSSLWLHGLRSGSAHSNGFKPAARSANASKEA